MSAKRVLVAGNPNVGKTSLFNALTGSRFRVGNYPGVTVESREGQLLTELKAKVDQELTLVDLPGTYSLTPSSEDEVIAFRELSAAQGQAGQAICLVVDAANLARNLYLFLQLAQFGVPMVVALNMVDVARAAGLKVDREALEAQLGCPVIETVARDGRGLKALAAALCKVDEAAIPSPAELGELPKLSALVGAGPDSLGGHGGSWLICALAAESGDLLDLRSEQGPADDALRYLEGRSTQDLHAAAQELIVARYRVVDHWLAQVVARNEGEGNEAPAMRRAQKIDAFVTHQVAGPLIFLVVMALVFQSIFTWATPFMDSIESVLGWTSGVVGEALGPGMLTDLLTEGVIAGVGNVLVFVPQIAILFFVLGLLEDVGYMARAAFIIDRLMSKVGLSGRAFVPLLSGYACSIPAIMGTRTIRRFRDRLITILMIPFMSCSARLPIYALIIGALFEANQPVAGPFTVGGLVLLSMYLLSSVSALAIGAIYRRTILPGPTPPLVLELPPYRRPRLRSVVRDVRDRTWDFLRDAGSIILAATIVLWGLLSFPEVDPLSPESPKIEVSSPDTAEQSPPPSPIELSWGGRFGKAIEPVLTPFGQDWRMGVGIIGSFAAREVLVSTLGLVYGIEGADDDDGPLREKIATARKADGSKRYTPLSGLALMVFFVYACQCMSTLAVVKRETRSWGWTIFMFVSMTILAYVMAVLVYQVGLALGFG